MMLKKSKQRIAMVLTLAVVLAALVGSAGTALAQQMIGGVIQCKENPCVATGAHQVLFERSATGSQTG